MVVVGGGDLVSVLFFGFVGWVIWQRGWLNE